MHRIKASIVLLLCFLLIIVFIPVCNASYVRPEIDIIREIANTYCWNPKGSQTRLEQLLNELRKTNEKAADDWQDIMDYWRFLDSDLQLTYDEIPDDLDKSDRLCFIVLGFQLNLDGTMKDELIARLEGVLSCAEKYPNAFILCTGGGTAGLKKDATEAGEMAKWLIDHGIDENRVLIEDQSVNTTANATLSYALMREKCPQVSSAVIISSDYHIRWGMLLFNTQFILAGREISLINHMAIHPPFQPGYSVREYMLDGVTTIAKKFA